MKYPNQRKNAATLSFIWHESHKGNSKAIKKNGNQHTTNAPVMIANVLAAFRSRFASNVSLRVLTWAWGFKVLDEDGWWCCIGVDIWLLFANWFGWWWWIVGVDIWFCTTGVGIPWLSCCSWFVCEQDVAWLVDTWCDTVAIWLLLKGWLCKKKILDLCKFSFTENCVHKYNVHKMEGKQMEFLMFVRLYLIWL